MASTPFTLSNQIIGRRFSAAAPPHSPNLRRSIRTSASYATAERTSAAGTGNASPPASLYEVLGVRASATGQEIKFAYRKLARVLHPDAAPNGDGAAADDFMRVHAAYATLSDPEKRAAYDGSLFRRRARTAVLSAGGYSARRRTWETDQCW